MVSYLKLPRWLPSKIVILNILISGKLIVLYGNIVYFNNIYNNYTFFATHMIWIQGQGVRAWYISIWGGRCESKKALVCNPTYIFLGEVLWDQIYFTHVLFINVLHMIYWPWHCVWEVHPWCHNAICQQQHEGVLEI